MRPTGRLIARTNDDTVEKDVRIAKNGDAWCNG